MKNLFYVFMLICFCSCGAKKALTTDIVDEKIVLTDNSELAKLYKEDQGDRKVAKIDWSVVSVNDSLRRARVYEILDASDVVTSNDFANAAMIFQHGPDTTSSGMAVKLMKKAIELNPQRNKWLYAAALDRHLMRKDQPQVYGTQFTRDGVDAPWVLYNVDETAVTDEERAEYNVPPLAEAKKRAVRMNKKKLMQLWEELGSIDKLIEVSEAENVDDFEYDISEGAINSFGYKILGKGDKTDALKIFEMNTRLNPEAYNTWDSLGECLLELGKKEEGVTAYKKSLELNPKNDNATKVLSELME